MNANRMTTPTVFLDCETDGLHPSRKAWEVAMIRRDDQGERSTSFFLYIDLAGADLKALEVGGYYDRHPFGRYISNQRPSPPKPDEYLDFTEAARRIARWTHGAVIVGAVPSFDTSILERLLRANSIAPAWAYRLVCVESLTAGHLGRIVGGLGLCAQELGLDISHLDRHTAMGDALIAMKIYDRIVTRGGDE